MHIKSAWCLQLKSLRRPIWKKGDIPITQIDGEVKFVGVDRLQSIKIIQYIMLIY
jgi:hypothetical protein